MEYYWNRNTEYSLAKLRRVSKGVAVIPLASIESHGPHLPLGSDTHCINHIVKQVLEQEKVAVLPTMEYSFVGSARAFLGAIHIPSDLLMQMVETVCDEVHRNGFDKIVLLHGHGGNDALLGAFARRMLEREKTYAVYVVPVLAGVSSEELKALLETDEYGHACEFETSMNMIACPDLVNLTALGKKTFPGQQGPAVGAAMTGVDWISTHPEMAVGVPQKATPEKGEAIFKLWIDSIVKHLRLIKKDKCALATMKSYAKSAHSHSPKRSSK